MSAPPVRTLADLDGDVLAHCAGYLGARDVASLAMACRPLRAAAYCDAVWYRLFRLFPLIDTPLFRSDTQKNEKALVTSSTDRTIRLCWKGYSRCYKGHSAPVTALADRLLMDGESKLLASGGEDCTIRLWSMSTRAKNHPLIATFHGHEKALSFLSVAWYALSNYLNEAHYTVTMHKSSLLVSCSKDSKVKVWDTVSPSSGSSSCVGSAHLNSNGPPIAMKCHESLCYIAAGAEVTAIDLRTMKKASVLALQNHRILSCEMMPSEWLICTGTKDRALLWDIRKAQELPNTVAEMQSSGPVTLLHLDQYKVVTGVPSDGQVHVWETRTGHSLNTLGCGEPSRLGVRSRVSAMAVDGCRIAMAGSSPEGCMLHYRDFATASAPVVSLPGKEKEVSRFWRPQEFDDSEEEEY
ncbi:F-box family protein [Zea mays]|uniref:F-box family protein n=1 Tax=Zea mays TaxID=4577 RepID=A0A1D6MI15_MAIZE|nr:F-box family protein [Zea mays]